MNATGRPEGCNTVTPNCIVSNVADAVAYYQKVFGAEELLRLHTPDGKVVHCELRIGDSRINLGESMEGWPEQPLLAQIYVPDADATVALAIESGAKALSPVGNMFFGTREGRVMDPFGNTWTIATHQKQVSGAEMQRLLNEMYA
ncbi:VOC family protein [Duganella vulcania]|uniref:VOC family protein n=1 Tax=Duganella vulcania TaxID=2692166 RepID=A0A845GL88_9BURK|nr:VOC family protein [Duganella vulcania]MYM93507.1 VOC family protein [Duganella vulcania]